VGLLLRGDAPCIINWKFHDRDLGFEGADFFIVAMGSSNEALASVNGSNWHLERHHNQRVAFSRRDDLTLTVLCLLFSSSLRSSLTCWPLR
jgi:hypothetical protein